MGVIKEFERRSRQVFLPVMGVCLIAYFAYHTVQGERGLFAYYKLSQEVTRAEQTLATLSERRERMDHRVSLLRPDNLDLDMLEERARAVLHLIREDEVVILAPKRPD